MPAEGAQTFESFYLSRVYRATGLFCKLQRCFGTGVKTVPYNGRDK